jgi:hypothetical protein
VSQSTRFNAPLIGLRSLGFVGALWARRTLVPVPRFAPLLLWRCVRGDPLPYTAGAPDQGADRIGFPIRRSHSLQRPFDRSYVIRVYGDTVGTMNVGSRASACPPFIVMLRERGPTAIHDRRPRSGHGSNLFLDLEITFLTPSSKKKIISDIKGTVVHKYIEQS